MLRITSIPAALAGAIASVSPVPARAAPPPVVGVTTDPAAVMVFAYQAEVTRVGQAEIPAGDSVLVVQGLPAAVAEDSISARAQADAPVEIAAVDLSRAAQDAAKGAARASQLQDQLDDLDGRIAAAEVKIRAANAEIQAVQRLAGIPFQPAYVSPLPAPGTRRAPGGGPWQEAAPRKPGFLPDPGDGPQLPPHDWKDAWTAVHDGMTEGGRDLLSAQRERDQLLKLRSDVERQLRNAGGPPEGTEARISVHADRPASLRLLLRYQVRGASWHPVYEARLNSVTGRLELTEEAVVRQATGEDWKHVRLTLSTSRPDVALAPPQMPEAVVRLYEPSPGGRGPVMFRTLAREAAKENLAAASPAAAAPRTGMAGERDALPSPRLDIAAQQVQAAAVNAGLTAEYLVPGVASIAADGTERKVSVGHADIPASLYDSTVPQLDPAAYLMARLTNTQAVPLMPGPVSLYRDGVYVGRAPLPLLRPGEEARLPYGPDDRVKVTYTARHPSKATEGTVWKDNVVRSGAVVTVHSFHTKPFPVTVLAQEPVSADADLKVAFSSDPDPTARDVDGRRGKMAWTYTYTPGQERRIGYDVTLAAPDGKRILGPSPWVR